MHKLTNRYLTVALTVMLLTSIAIAAPGSSQLGPAGHDDPSQLDQKVATLSPITLRLMTKPEATGPGQAQAKDEGRERRERADNVVAFGFSSFMYNVFAGVSASAGYYINPDLLAEVSIAGAASFTQFSNRTAPHPDLHICLRQFLL